jgi:hypothetical protein
MNRPDLFTGVFGRELGGRDDIAAAEPTTEAKEFAQSLGARPQLALATLHTYHAILSERPLLLHLLRDVCYHVVDLHEAEFAAAAIPLLVMLEVTDGEDAKTDLSLYLSKDLRMELRSCVRSQLEFALIRRIVRGQHTTATDLGSMTDEGLRAQLPEVAATVLYKRGTYELALRYIGEK